MRSSTPSSPGSWVISVRRSLAYLVLISPSSVGDDGAQAGRVARIASSSAMVRAQLLHLLLEVGPAQAGEPAQRHVEDVLGLLLAEGEGLGHERGSGRGPVLGGADGGDHGVEHVDGLEQALDDVGPVAGLAQAELRAAGDHLDLVSGVVRHGLGQVERAGHAVHQGHHVHGEVGLQRGVLVEVVEHHVGVGVALERHHQAGHACRPSRSGRRRCRRARRRWRARRSSARSPRPRSGRGCR